MKSGAFFAAIGPAGLLAGGHAASRDHAWAVRAPGWVMLMICVGLGVHAWTRSFSRIKGGLAPLKGC